VSTREEYPTLEERAARLAAELVIPLREIGAELERQVSEVRAELAILRRLASELGVRVARLSVLVDDGAHSQRTAPLPASSRPGYSAYPCLCRTCGESFESTDQPEVCPKCDSDDVATGALFTVVEA